MTSSDYQPIDCSFYDLLEADATLAKVSTIIYRNKTGQTVEEKAVIKNLYIREKVEYLILSNNTEIRLDTIVTFNGTPLPKNPSCQIKNS